MYRILQVIPYLAIVAGGPSAVVKGLAAGLTELGEQVDVITTGAGLETTDCPDDWILEDNYRVRIFDQSRLAVYHYNFPLVCWLRTHITEYDIVHIHEVFSFPSLFAAIWSKRNGIPFIITPHGSFNPLPINYRGKRKRLFLMSGGKWLLNSAGAIQALSVIEERSTRSLGITAPIRIIKNGIDFSGYQKPPPRNIFVEHFSELQNKFLFGYLGRLHPHKGLDRLILAFSQIYSKNSDRLRLVLAGPGHKQEQDDLRRLARETGCENGIVFTGLLLGEEKRSFLNSIDVFCLPSHFEGCSIALLEAMATGLPCVVTPGCQMPVAHRRGALIEVDSDDLVSSLAETMEKLEGDAELRNRLADNARNYVQENHDQLKIAGVIRDLYRQCIEESSDREHE